MQEVVLKSNEFACEVLAKLEQRKVTFRGLKPETIEIALDGGCKVWFSGIMPDGKYKRSGVAIVNNGDVMDAVHFGKPEVIAELCEGIIDHTQLRFY